MVNKNTPNITHLALLMRLTYTDLTLGDIVEMQVKNKMKIKQILHIYHGTIPLSNTKFTQIKVKEQLVVRKDMDVNELERITNVTLRHMSM
jgi:hypothetical protein